jgi:hypothetical protein
MFKAFVTGFATQASKEIEERHKEIQEMIYAEMENTNKSNEEVRKRAAKDLETRAGLAREVNAMLSGVNMDPEEKKRIAYEMVMNPEAAKYYIDAVKEGRAGADSIGSFIELPKTEDQAPTKKIPDDIAEAFKARPRAGATPPDLSQTRGAFGLPMGGSAQRARDFAMAKLRMTEEEAGGLEYTPPTPSEGVLFNFDALRKADSDTMAKTIDRLQMAAFNETDPVKQKEVLSNLDRALAIKVRQETRVNGFNESNVRSNFRVAINRLRSEFVRSKSDLISVPDPENKDRVILEYAPTMSLEKIREIESQVIRGLKPLIDEYTIDGKVPSAVRIPMMAFGIEFDAEGRPQYGKPATQRGGQTSGGSVEAERAKTAAEIQKIQKKALPVAERNRQIQTAKEDFKTRTGTTY